MKYKSIKVHSNSSINALSTIGGTNFILTGGGNDNLVKLTHLEDEEVFEFPKEHLGSINSIDHLDELVVSSGEYDTLVLWDLMKRYKLNKYKTDPISILNNSIMDAKIYKDLLILCGTNCQLNFHDLRASQLKPITILKDSTDSLTLFDYCPSTYSVSAASLDGKVYSYDLRKSEVQYSSESKEDSILDLVIYDKYLLLTFESGKVQLVNMNDKEVECERNGGLLNHRVNSILIDCYYDGKKKYIASGSETGQINLWRWSMDENKTTDKINNFEFFKAMKTKNKSLNLLNTVRFVNSSNRLISSSGDGIVHIWDNVI